MATWRETYVRLAIAFDATLSNVPEDIKHLDEARFALVDLTTIDDGSEPGYGTEAATELSRDMDLLYRTARRHFAYDPWRDNMVEKINKFSERFFGDLDNFVNSLEWPDLCIPFYWAALSENANFDTSNWNICS